MTSDPIGRLPAFECRRTRSLLLLSSHCLPERVETMAPKDAATISVEAGDKGKPDREAEELKIKNQKEPEDDKVAETSEEDRELKERLETCVSTLINKEADEKVTTPIRLNALDVIVTELRSATSSMTSVPKPLKFLRPHYNDLKELYKKISSEEKSPADIIDLRARLADVLAVLAMTLGKQEDRESLKFKLAAIKDHNQISKDKDPKKIVEELGSWGHELVRSLAGEIGEEYAARVLEGADPEDDEKFADILHIVDVIVRFHVTHNAEAEAVDLLIEVQRLKNLLQLDSITENNYERICLYLVKTADFMSDPDDLTVSQSHEYLLPFRSPDAVFANIPFTFLRKCLRQPLRSTVVKNSSLMRCVLL